MLSIEKVIDHLLHLSCRGTFVEKVKNDGECFAPLRSDVPVGLIAMLCRVVQYSVNKSISLSIEINMSVTIGVHRYAHTNSGISTSLIKNIRTSTRINISLGQYRTLLHIAV